MKFIAFNLVVLGSLWLLYQQGAGSSNLPFGIGAAKLTPDVVDPAGPPPTTITS